MGGLESFVGLLRAGVEALGEWRPVARVGSERFLVVGDTHGYVEVSRWALELAGELGVGAVVFLGDLVDRGPCGVENLAFLAEAVAGGGLEVVLVRGDHESLLLNTYYGFRGELRSKVGAEAEGVVEEFYSSMPLAAVAGPVFMVHGGIPCRKCMLEEEPPYTLGEIEEEVWGELGEDPEARALGHGRVSTQLMWNDPRGAIDWFLPSARGQGIYYYGRAAWREFLKANGLKLVVRAHEAADGFHVWTPEGDPVGPLEPRPVGIEDLEGSVVTVFSSLYHGGRAGALLVDLGEGVVEPFYYNAPGGGGC